MPSLSLGALWQRQIDRDWYGREPFAATPERVERLLTVQDIGKRRLRRPPPETHRRCEGFVLTTGKPCKAWAIPGSDFCAIHERYVARRENGHG